jgi:diguanylate cyclase (GGDEF)-like protein
LSWTDYTHAKSFGKGIFRPYSDLIADILLQLDNLLADDPPFARSCTPFATRDTVLIIGEKILLFAISRSSYRHHPRFETYNWNEFWTIPEPLFLAQHGLALREAQRVVLPDLLGHLTKSFSFVDPFVFSVPSVFQPVATPEIRAQVVMSAAHLIWAEERQHFEKAPEIEPPSEKEKEQKFGLLCSLRQASPDFASYCSGLRSDAAVGVLFLDIDDFKSLNTRFTEVVVDRDVLIPFHRLLRAICLHRGEAYLHGGDEFLVLLPNQTSDEVAQFAKRLREQVAAEEFSVGASSLHITVSIGIALWPKDGDTLENLIAMANVAEHEAKAKGKNRIAIHSKDARSKAAIP